MLSGRSRLTLLPLIVCLAVFEPVSHAVQVPASSTVPGSTLVLHQLGKGSAPLDGPWQFHLGDDPSYASPTIDDTAGHNGWEQLTADAPWGAQTHPNTEGYGWYRRHIDITPAEGASSDVALLIPAIDDVYEIYWNGQLVGHLGNMPPHWVMYSGVPPQTYGLGPIRSGVLAIRVWKVVFSSNDDGTAGGFEGVPVIGSPQAIAALKGAGGFKWLRGQQFRFGLTSLYVLVSLLSFFAWLRDRKQWLLFWMGVYAIMPLLDLTLLGLGLPFNNIWLTFFVQSTIQLREISQWFLLLWLLQLHEYPRVTRLIRWVAIVAQISGTLDGALGFIYPSLITGPQFQIVDAALTVFILPPEAIPALLVVYALYRRQRLDSGRWIVATFAVINATTYAVSNIAAQGVRFTHWTLAANMAKPLFVLNGNPIGLQTLLRTLLFLSIVYAVIRYSIENSRRQTALEREFQNARELQQVLVPETLPAIPGFTLTSAYRPAQEVGGDFFQIIPLEPGIAGETGGTSTLIVLGDVSGKGLKAAMAVSLIIGTVRALADDYSDPAALLTQLNRRLCGRMQGGFATCIILRLSPGVESGRECLISSAGHPAPFLNDREIDLPGALPLGLAPEATYEDARLQLSESDHLALYTDGLLEARNPSGELYGFHRLQTLFSTLPRPNASQATEAAVLFGQDDDITVLTLTRLSVGSESTSSLAAPFLETAAG